MSYFWKEQLPEWTAVAAFQGHSHCFSLVFLTLWLVKYGQHDFKVLITKGMNHILQLFWLPFPDTLRSSSTTSAPLSIWLTKPFKVSFRRSWYCWYLLQHRESTSLTVAEQCMPQAGWGISSSSTGWAADAATSSFSSAHFRFFLLHSVTHS